MFLYSEILVKLFLRGKDSHSLTYVLWRYLNRLDWKYSAFMSTCVYGFLWTVINGFVICPCTRLNEFAQTANWRCLCKTADSCVSHELFSLSAWGTIVRNKEMAPCSRRARQIPEISLCVSFLIGTAMEAFDAQQHNSSLLYEPSDWEADWQSKNESVSYWKVWF